MYAEFEGALGETDRARAIFSLAIGLKDAQTIPDGTSSIGNSGPSQIALDMPEKVWKAYIDFEVENGQIGQARTLYRALLQRTKHVKVWASFAKFEAELARNMGQVRELMEQAQDHFRDVQPDLKEERKMLLETWLDIELNQGDTKHIDAVKSKLPIKVKKLVKTGSDKNPETAT